MLNKRLSSSFLLFMFIIYFMSQMNLLATAEALEYRADRLYKEGEEAFKNKHFHDAINFFGESYKIYPHTITAYYLACTYVEMARMARNEIENVKYAQKWAEKSLNEKPPLQEKYNIIANEIYRWANDPGSIIIRAEKARDSMSMPRIINHPNIIIPEGSFLIPE